MCMRGWLGWMIVGFLIATIHCANDRDAESENNGVDSGVAGHGGASDEVKGASGGGGGDQTRNGGLGGQWSGLPQADAQVDGRYSGAEVCDGTDNDGNGITDDVDVDSDGVCDCLNIATIGEIGPWSDGGNVFENWLTTRSPNGYVALKDKVLTDDLLKPYQVIVVLYVGTVMVYGNSSRTAAPHHAFSNDEVAAFERWVRNGGGAMATIGYAGDEYTEATNVNRLLAPLGMGYSTTKLYLGGYVKKWTPHELTDRVSNIFTDNGSEPDGPKGTSLAWDEGGRVALQVSQADNGRIVVWGDEWITYDSQWQAVADQQVARFWLNILQWLSPPKVCRVPPPPLV